MHFIHFKFQTFIRADKVLPDLVPATSPPLLLPFSAPPALRSHTGLQTVPKIIELLPDSGSLFLQQHPQHSDLSMAGFLLTIFRSP